MAMRDKAVRDGARMLAAATTQQQRHEAIALLGAEYGRFQGHPNPDAALTLLVGHAGAMRNFVRVLENYVRPVSSRAVGLAQNDRAIDAATAVMWAASADAERQRISACCVPALTTIVGDTFATFPLWRAACSALVNIFGRACFEDSTAVLHAARCATFDAVHARMRITLGALQVHKHRKWSAPISPQLPERSRDLYEPVATLIRAWAGMFQAATAHIGRNPNAVAASKFPSLKKLLLGRTTDGAPSLAGTLAPWIAIACGADLAINVVDLKHSGISTVALMAQQLSLRLADDDWYAAAVTAVALHEYNGCTTMHWVLTAGADPGVVMQQRNEALEVVQHTWEAFASVSASMRSGLDSALSSAAGAASPSPAALGPNGKSKDGKVAHVCANEGCTASDMSYATKLHRCRGCKTTYYCGAACQRAHWKSHKSFCKQAAQQRKSEERDT